MAHRFTAAVAVAIVVLIAVVYALASRGMLL